MEFIKTLEAVRSPFLDLIVSFMTMLGEETIAMVLICVLFWCVNKNIAYSVGLSFFLSGLTVQGLKICFRVPRPWVLDPTFNPVPSAIEHASGYSFPSGHTQSAASFYGAISIESKNKAIRILCIMVVFCVAFSRLYLGVHTPSDVIASLIISAFFAIVASRLLKAGDAAAMGEAAWMRRELLFCILIVAYSAIAILVALAVYFSPSTGDVYITDCLKAASAGVGFGVGMYVERVYIRFSTETKAFSTQLKKLFPGLIGVVLIKEGFKLIFGISFIADSLRYFLMVMWVLVFFPLMIKRFFVEEM